MKRLALLMTVLICSAATIAAEGDQPQPPEQQMQRIQNAQKELEQQRQHFDRERQEFERQRDKSGTPRPQHKPMWMGAHKPICTLLMVMCAVVHILVAVWVFQDIRARGVGSGIWIVIALIAGLLGALVYAVVRLGDVKKS